MTEEQVFLLALDLADPADRAAYLEKACGGDVEFRREVEDLLAAHFKPGEFLDEPIGKQLAAGAATPIPNDTVDLNANPGGDAVNHAKKPAEEPDDLHFLQPSTRPDSLGRIGHYEVLQVLGKGGFGIVFRAFDDVLHRVAALKVLAPTVAATSPARKRFLREALSSAQVRHENVVQVYAVEEQPLPYLVMEFIPGETLQQRLDRTGPLEVPEIVRLGRMAEGLAAAHATGLIHRDIKPGNVLLEEGPQGRVKITDFGLARAADDASLTQSGVLAGTPMYMAPVQARGEKLDHRADLFSLGSVLYVMASGRPPFRASTTYAVLKRVVDDNPRPIQEVIPEMPQWLCDIIARLHAKKRENRFQTAHEVASVLADCEDQLKENPKSKDFFRIPQSKATARQPGRRMWVAAAALLLPVLALVLTEIAGFTHLFRGRESTPIARLDLSVSFDAKGAGEPSAKQVGVGAPTTDPDRRAAENVLALGGMIKINDQAPQIKALAALPKGAFRLTYVYLDWNNSKATDAVLIDLKECKDLTYLDLYACGKITDGGVVHLMDCKQLTWLGLYGSQVTDAGLVHLKDLKNLTTFRLGRTRVTDAGLVHFKDHEKLTSIDLSETRVTEEGLAHFKGCKNMEILNLEGCKQVSDVGLAHFKDCKNLIRLHLGGTQVTDAGLALFKDCRNLSLLGLNGTHVGDVELAHFKDCKNLRQLDLLKAMVTAEAIDELKKALPQCRIKWDHGVIEPR